MESKLLDKVKLKEIIVAVAKSSDVTVDSIKDDTKLIGPDGIFFDSIDVLELMVEIEKNFGVKIKDKDLNENKLENFSKFYDFLSQNEKK